ncbi:uncharacterized protein PV07_00001 [Cladophialophora immunda]|uniref:Xylanolytic transcriptional activator regulatory domain-containing protein n=1 Tax=Cladophialophora immunda TaxID=569365 RepID=A0A0D2CT91_9EURO|nr:uncharacterized protein PV07_00001 [Cladophialophora immunda]KIW33130.1 hypothetical protein PV07_00001 [Cladophialophora immunda]
MVLGRNGYAYPSLARNVEIGRFDVMNSTPAAGDVRKQVQVLNMTNLSSMERRKGRLASTCWQDWKLWKKRVQSAPQAVYVGSQASAEDAISESGVNLEDYAHRNSITPHSTGIPEEPTIEPDSVDGMGAIALSDSGEYYTHFGPSSNLALASHLYGYSSFHDESRSRLASRVQYLPPEPEATALLQQYFGTVGLFSPCIQEDTILATYKELRRNDPQYVRRSWLALLYMIFADTHGLRSYASPPDAAMEVSQKCFQKALKLAIPETITYSDLETVQLLCLTTCHLQGSTSSAQAWTFHVLAVKAAMQIGLHHTDSYSNLSLLQRETRKRTWFWCVVNDCLLSVHFGRPSIIQSALTKMDLPVDISSVFPAGGQSPSVLKSSLIYYNSIIRLSVLISPILAQIYDDNVGSHKNRTVFETYI